MIHEVDVLLSQWAEWVDRRESNALGYQMSTLNGQMQAACCEHPAQSQGRGLEGRIEELMSLVDVVLCTKVSPSAKAVIDRYYRGQIGGEHAVKTMGRTGRANSHAKRYAEEAGVNRSTIQRWVHNAHVEFQKVMDSLRHGIKSVGVFGVVRQLSAMPAAANDEYAA